MIKIFEIVFSFLRRKNYTPTIKISATYGSEECSNIFTLPQSILDDVKEHTYRRLYSNAKLLKKVNEVGFIIVNFHRRTPLPMAAVEITHLFYWSNDCLYSSTQETNAVTRDIKINQILN